MGTPISLAMGQCAVIYLSILASHIILSVAALPLVLVTFSLSLTRSFPIHRKVARYSFPIWLYVSITGVVVFAMLRDLRILREACASVSSSALRQRKRNPK